MQECHLVFQLCNDTIVILAECLNRICVDRVCGARNPLGASRCHHVVQVHAVAQPPGGKQFLPAIEPVCSFAMLQNLQFVAY
jgi:hypothetical protein